MDKGDEKCANTYNYFDTWLSVVIDVDIVFGTSAFIGRVVAGLNNN